jgi:hypothetical protein
MFLPVDAIPSGYHEALAPQHGRHVLAIGEASGHSHSILANRARFFVADRPTTTGIIVGYLDGDAEAEVEHLKNLQAPAEHPALPLTGRWQVRRQQEWSDEREPRRVED